MSELLNDVHSRLNPTEVHRVERPENLDDLRRLLKQARAEGRKISVSGARHAMGGQQFAQDSLHLDLRALNRVIERDPERGLLHIEAGADWPCIIAATETLHDAQGRRWAIRQKQTGVDEVTLGGSIAANAHGRGLRMRPIGDDIEHLTLLTADGELKRCSRSENAELFALVIGGFGLFGIVVSACLRLSPRQRMQRVVEVVDIDVAAQSIRRRMAQGAVYGDFQFAIDAQDESFLRRGVLACYLPCAEPVAVNTAEAAAETTVDLQADAWLQLLTLAHEDKSAAFRLYAEHYLATQGQTYWSDTLQLATYIPSYADYLHSRRCAADAGAVRESLVIGEHYVPYRQLLTFMTRARHILRQYGSEIIYGTIRAIRRDRSAFLSWAKDNFACVIFNLRTVHNAAGIARTHATFRALTEASLNLGGSFFLTYHRAASAEQVQRAYPMFAAFLKQKLRHDPEEIFSSDWYRHYRDAFAAYTTSASAAAGAGAS